MKKNVGVVDQLIRALLSLMAVAIYAMAPMPMFIGLFLLGTAAVLLITSVTGVCPLYRVLGINTSHAKGSI